MTTVTVFEHAPPPLIGVCGVVPDRAFEAFEGVTDALATDGPRCLPLILVDGVIVSSGVHPTRTQLARVVGQHRSQTEPTAAR
jgi:hypothetical protein